MNEHERNILRAARGKVRIQRDGKSVEMTRQQALIDKNHELAFKGSVHAIRNANEQIAKALAAEAAEIAEECARWSEIKDRQAKALKRFVQSVGTGAKILPHPDDILIDHRTGVRILGPISEEDWPTFAEMVRLRDALYFQHAMEDGHLVPEDGDHLPPSTPLILAMLQNKVLPPSLKLNEEAEQWHLWKLQRMPRREALKACRAAWRRLGMEVSRGRRMMSHEVLLPLFAVLRDFMDEVRAVGDSVAALDAAADHMARRLAYDVPWPKRIDPLSSTPNRQEQPA